MFVAGADPLTGPPPLRLDPVAADRHVAPRARPVLGSVVEGEQAALFAAGLEPAPLPAAHRIVTAI